MIIVNQNKNEIINFDNIERIDITVSKGFLGYNVNFETAIARGVLGNYATEERAKEVLQEIAQKYSSYLKLEGGAAILQGQMDIQPNIFNIPKVYEMPEK